MIYTRSKFNYGHSVTIENAYIPFKEGAGPELIAIIAFGDYTLGEYASAVQDALNSAGDFDYQVTVDRSANHLIINSTGIFSFLTNTGSVLSSSAFSMMGLNYPAADLVGDNVYRSNGTCGSEYYPQFYLQSYVPSKNFAESVGATLNESADGRLEVVRFGIKRKIKMDIKFITNKLMDNDLIRYNPNGYQAALDLLDYITQKKRFEFVADELQPTVFEKVILESCPGHSDGTGYELKELIEDHLPDIYETGVITLRVVA